MAERFELYVAGVELCNGFDELTDAREQRARFERGHGAPRTRRAPPPTRPTSASWQRSPSGMPRAGGNALGFDRLLMLATGARELAEVIAFPAQEL